MSAKVSREELSKNYRKAPRKDEKAEGEEAPKNELRVGPLRTPKTYISSAIDMFEEGEKTIVVKGRGKAVSAVVNIVEVVKRRVKGLHQLSEMESIEVVDVYELKSGEGETVEIKKYICGLKVVLSKDELDTKAPGYQEPIPESEVTEEKKELRKPKGGKGGGAAGRGKGGKSGARGGGGRGAGGKGGRGAAARGGSRGGAAGAR